MDYIMYGVRYVRYWYVAVTERHRLIPFAMEDGGRIGAHGQAALRMLAEFAVAKGKLPPTVARVAPLSFPEAVAMWTHRWQQRLFCLASLDSITTGPPIPSPRRGCRNHLLLDCLYGSIRSRSMTIWVVFHVIRSTLLY